MFSINTSNSHVYGSPITFSRTTWTQWINSIIGLVWAGAWEIVVTSSSSSSLWCSSLQWGRPWWKSLAQKWYVGSVALRCIEHIIIHSAPPGLVDTQGGFWRIVTGRRGVRGVSPGALSGKVRTTGQCHGRGPGDVHAVISLLGGWWLAPWAKKLLFLESPAFSPLPSDFGLTW